MEVFVKDFYKIMDSFQGKQVVVGHINTNAEIEVGVSPIYDIERRSSIYRYVGPLISF